MHIRPFCPDDAEALWWVFHDAIHQTAAADYSPAQLDAWAPGMHDADVWRSRMTALAPFVAEVRGNIAGYADVQPNGYIDHFFVAPRFGRQGVGSALMQRIHDAAGARDTAELFSNVSLTARPLFDKWGFAVEAQQTVKRGPVELTNFRMRKRLTGNEPDARES